MRLFTDEVAEGYRRDGWWSGRTWSDRLDEHSSERPDVLALVDAPNRLSFTTGVPRSLTWADVGAEVDRLARVLFAHGVSAGTVVGVQLPNIVELPMIYLAVARLGGIVTPFPVQYRSYELERMGTAAGMQVFVTAAQAVSRPLAAESAALDVPTLAHVLAFGEEAGEGYELIDSHLAAQQPDPLFDEYVSSLSRHPNDCITLVWTSGTEGVPKGVPRAYGDWDVLGESCIQSPKLCSNDILLNPFPMVNGGGLAGMFVPWMILGATLIQHHPLALDVFIDQIEAHGVTYTCAPPMVLDALVADDSVVAGRDISTLRAVSSGSAPLSGWMIHRWEANRGVEVLNLFGSNEGGVLYADPDTVPDPAERGRFFPRYGVPGMPYRTAVAAAMQARLVDLEDGTEITETGRAGELRLKGPTIFSGYWHAGRSGFDEQGWFCTGDVFEISTHNPDYLTHVDRAKDLIIRGGYKISAAEIEGMLIAEPEIVEVAAVAMPDERLGERMCLFVVPADPSTPPTLESLISRLIDQDVAKFKLPERLEIVSTLPRNAIGKILKRELRERLTSAATPA